MKKQATALLLAALAGWCGLAQAASAVFVPASGISDMAHDFRRGVIYIANVNRILRYSVASRTFLSSIPISAGTSLTGMDISADGRLLAVADSACSATQTWIYLVDLDTLAVSRRPFANGYGECGTWSVAFTADGKVLATSVSQVFTGGAYPLRRLTPATGAWTTVAAVAQETMLAPSTDRKTIAFAEGDSSNGPWGLYDVPTGQVVRSEWSAGTQWFNYEIATDALGSQFAIPTYDGTYVYNDTYQHVRTIGEYAGGQPVGAAYHPVRPLVYFPWAESSDVRVYNATTGAWVQTIPMGEEFTNPGSSAYQVGRIKLSADGSLVMVTVASGLRFVEMYAPLRAAAVSATVSDGVASPITLQGSIGNGGALAYIVGKPAHGTVTVSGNTATYTATPGYSGSDSFLYQVRYGLAAVASATVRVTVQ